MAEISINEYIRTDNGIIIKYQFLEESENFEVFFGQKGKGFTFEDMEEFEDFINQRVVKHSKDIIDLIQEGDYVNGNEITEISQDPFVKGQINLWTDIELRDVYGDYERLKYICDDIKTIVTKEQFSQMEYKVKE